MTFDISFLIIGWALTLTQNVYLVGTMVGVGDGYFDSQMNQSKLSVAMYGIGARHYLFQVKSICNLDLILGPVEWVY
jgi:hypothetical protein